MRGKKNFCFIYLFLIFAFTAQYTSLFFTKILSPPPKKKKTELVLRGGQRPVVLLKYSKNCILVNNLVFPYITYHFVITAQSAVIYFYEGCLLYTRCIHDPILRSQQINLSSS